jgi:hypothetical protein
MPINEQSTRTMPWSTPWQLNFLRPTLPTSPRVVKIKFLTDYQSLKEHTLLLRCERSSGAI